MGGDKLNTYAFSIGKGISLDAAPSCANMLAVSVFAGSPALPRGPGEIKAL